jgi:hypothetical protein
MSEITEIYSVRGEANIRDGALEYSESVASRNAAEADAQARCGRDPSIRKVVYYRVREDGSFRTLFSYDNPNAGAPKARKPRRQMADTLPRGTGRRPPQKGKPGLIDRLMSVLKD